ncbi:hypothetical protein J4734_26965 [Klebsiella pneumoniae]|uniref:Uncharacterized protein n=1 Tax=Klebsiella pneumoniae TaxID=573 RepID=A0A939NRM7_KLEPN|nr:hypothetical protein [Klebsiella pneumoniae]
MLLIAFIVFSQINLAGDSGGDKGGAAFFEQGDTLFRLANQSINAGGFAVEGGRDGLFVSVGSPIVNDSNRSVGTRFKPPVPLISDLAIVLNCSSCRR